MAETSIFFDMDGKPIDAGECPPGSVEEHAGMVKCEDCGIELKAER